MLLKDLTEREKDVYELLLQGKSRRAIAQKLIVEPSTVQTHTQNIYKKRGVHSHKELLINRIKELEKWMKRDIHNKLK